MHSTITTYRSVHVAVHRWPRPSRSSTTSAALCCATTSATRWSTTARRSSGTSWRCPAGPRWSYWARGATCSSLWWARATATSWRSSPAPHCATTGSAASWRSTSWAWSCWETPCQLVCCHSRGRLPWTTSARGWWSPTPGTTGSWWSRPPPASSCTSLEVKIKLWPAKLAQSFEFIWCVAAPRVRSLGKRFRFNGLTEAGHIWTIWNLEILFFRFYL